MRYRVDDLAARCGLSVDTVRFYQSRGLLAPPEREGRVAWYSGDHLDRLHRIRDLKEKGFTLGSIKSLLDGGLDAADEALVAAVTGEGASADVRLMTLEELASTTGVSTALLQAIEREGLLAPRAAAEGPRYTESDLEAVTAGLALLETGLPLSELLDLARRHDQAMREIARQAVEMFVRFVRDPIRASAVSEPEVAERLVAAFRKMLPATTSLVANHFRRVLLAEAQARIESDGRPEEIEAGESLWLA
jgi:DNA-binding transcriptional MerR regulator